MAQQRYTYGVRVVGDSKDAVKAIQLTERELQGLTRDVNRAARGMDRLDQTTTVWARSLGGLKNAIGPLAGAAGAGLLARMTTQTLSSVAALSEQADVAGVSTERFQELTKAFSDMAGVAESITAGGLRRFNRRFGLAAEGTGAAVDALETLNIELDQETEPALNQVIERLASMENGARRAALASQVFGEDAGPKIAAALGQGTQAIIDQIAKLREQGRIMDDETTEAARSLNDEFNELYDSWKTTGQGVLVGMAQAFENLGAAIGAADLEDSDVLRNLQNKLDSLQRAEANDPGGNTARTRLIEETQRDIALIEEGGVKLRALVDQRRELNAELRESVGALSGARPVDEGPALRRVEELRDRLYEVNQQINQIRGIEPVRIGISPETADPISLPEVPGLNVMPSVEEMADTFREARERAIAGADDLRMASAGNPISAEGLIADLPEVNRDMRELEEAANGVNEAGQRMQSTMRGFGDIATSSLEEAVLQLESLRNVANAALEDIARVILRTQVTGPLGDAIGGINFGSFFGGGGSSSGVAANVPMSANGNVFTGPSMTTIAERGEPEAVFPLTRMGGKLGIQAAGGGTDVQIIDQRGGDAPAIETQRSRGVDGRQQVRMIIRSEVRDGMNRGDFDRQMQGNFGVTRRGAR